MPKLWRILSIDGGGIRGLIPATILAAIEERTGSSIAELFDIIAGTSTGGILALGLTKPNQHGRPQFAAQDLRDVYERDAPHIFRNPASWLENLLRPKYVSSSGISKIMRQNLGDTRLKDAVTDILIPCYDIEHCTPHIFKSHWARRHTLHDFNMSDVACAAAATPTMFEPVHLHRPEEGKQISLVDGGVFANNPSLLAFAEAAKLFAAKGDDFLVVSLGTGESMAQMRRKHISDWGFIRWSMPMIELVSESNSEAVHEQMRYLLPTTDYQRYYRLQVDLPDNAYYALDDPSKENMAGLINAAEELLRDRETKEQMNRLCELLLSNQQHRNVESLERLNQPSCTQESDNILVSVPVEIRAQADTLLGKSSSDLMQVAVEKKAQYDELVSELARAAKLSRARKASAICATRARSRKTLEAGAHAMADNAHECEHGHPLRLDNCAVVLCYEGEDLAVARPLADALKERGITAVFEKFGSQPRESTQCLSSHAAGASVISIVILSPALLKNTSASKLIAWLQARTLNEKYVIVPVLHRVEQWYIHSLAWGFWWHKKHAKFWKCLIDSAEGTTALGIGPLADQLACTLAR